MALSAQTIARSTATLRCTLPLRPFSTYSRACWLRRVPAAVAWQLKTPAPARVGDVGDVDKHLVLPLPLPLPLARRHNVMRGTCCRRLHSGVGVWTSNQTTSTSSSSDAKNSGTSGAGGSDLGTGAHDTERDGTGAGSSERIERLQREREFMRSRLYKSGFSDHIQVQGEQQAKEFVATTAMEDSPTPRDGLIMLTRVADGKAGTPFPMSDALGTTPTVLTVSFKAYGRAQALEWQQTLYDAGLVADAQGAAGDDTFGDHHDGLRHPPPGTLRVLDMNVMEGWVLRFFRGPLFRGLLQASPPWLADNVVAHLPTHTEVLCGELQVHNRLLGYVFLLDAQGRVRWRAHGVPQPEELAALVAVSQELLAGR